MNSARQSAERLIAWLRPLNRVVVAFSGGVDSSVVAAAAMQADLEDVVAVTADSPSVARWQVDTARRIAAEIGITHRLIVTDEVSRPDYRRNDASRCFHCKQTLYQSLSAIAEQFKSATVISGTNAEDLGDYRPGISAGNLAGVRTPLAELGLNKAAVRAIAEHFGLSNSSLPASPCLASRIAYGVEVTPERLARVENAEAWLRERGFELLRVRLHADELGRIEVPRSELERLMRLEQNGELTETLRGFGFRYVTVDLQGFQSGSMNRTVVQLGTQPLTNSSPNKPLSRRRPLLPQSHEPCR